MLASPVWFMNWSLPSGKPWLSCARTEEGYLIRFTSHADFWIDRTGSEIRCLRRPNTPDETFRHLLLDIALPMVVNLRGSEALHASAVVTSQQGVLAFAGPSGSGKSTLASIFLRAGDRLLTDDCLALSERREGIFGEAGYPGLRLWKRVADELYGGQSVQAPVAHYSSKGRLEVNRGPATYSSEAQSLQGIYVLVEAPMASSADPLRVDALSPKDQLIALLSFCFRLDITDRAMLQRQFRFFEQVTARVPIRRIYLPRNAHRLDHLRESLLTDAARASLATPATLTHSTC
jgi:hypothetical protein